MALPHLSVSRLTLVATFKWITRLNTSNPVKAATWGESERGSRIHVRIEGLGFKAGLLTMSSKLRRKDLQFKEGETEKVMTTIWYTHTHQPIHQIFTYIRSYTIAISVGIALAIVIAIEKIVTLYYELKSYGELKRGVAGIAVNNLFSELYL